MRALAMHSPIVSPGEAGGIFAGVIALVVAIGHGAKWLLNWNDERANSRSAKLQAWDRELEAREARMNAEIEQRLQSVERENRSVSQSYAAVIHKLDRMRIAYRIIAAALIEVSPHSAALVQASAILNEPLPVPTAEEAAAMAAIDAKEIRE